MARKKQFPARQFTETHASCTNCNRGLGHFKESISNLENAIMYLKTHSGSVDAAKEGRCL